MPARRWLALIVPSLLLAGCAGSGPDLGTNIGGLYLFSASPASEEAARRAEQMEIGVELPAGDAIDTGRRRGIASADCRRDEGRQAGYEEALQELTIKVANDGADYLQVLGNGPLESRGSCRDGYYRLNGRGFRTADAGPATSADTGEPADAAAPEPGSLTARLEEIEALRDRGLINRDEYEQLRQHILSNPE
ncbi:hypothetical protein GJ672_02245 [Spiribacter sp. 2438]|uniref:SHOCT domain-containing protein n=1 Tax=Spiribacter sp. 2438 TaxID=2666185 RepID=UPI0012B122FB|nr:SHOCT domain-containing protein [Spiribacter sp. 2438]QGM21208.1 hypothetical protein GJ672_02245 [Spiribacter sp. 2438]